VNPEWVRIRSWHVLVPTRALPFTAFTRCGRKVPAPEIRADLPTGKSCETCLRLVARDAEKADR
jgi:hypothetical protein